MSIVMIFTIASLVQFNLAAQVKNEQSFVTDEVENLINQSKTSMRSDLSF